MTSTPSPPDPRAALDDRVGHLLRLAGPPAAPDEALRARVEGAALAVWARGLSARRTRRRLAWGAAGLAASVLAFLGLPRWLGSPGELDRPPRVATLLGAAGQLEDPRAGGSWDAGVDFAAGAALASGPGVRATLALSHGRTLRIDELSRLALESPGRIRLSAGALYVDSPEGAEAAPLEISTPLGILTEEGTRFEVRVEGEVLSLRVREGRVALRHGRDLWHADGGQRLDLDPGGSPQLSAWSPADPSWSWTWRAGVSFALEGESLDRFLAWYETESARPLRLLDDRARRAAPSIVLHGSIAGLPPDDALAVVLRSVGWRARAADGGWLLEPARRSQP
jgi:ferric-dicitrate binding protein FerR (iron transport regulator)